MFTECVWWGCGVTFYFYFCSLWAGGIGGAKRGKRGRGDDGQYRGAGGWCNAPAPVVPPARLDERMEGDWWTVRSRPAMVSSTVAAFGSMKPRFCEGRSCANSSNVSRTTARGC